MFDENSIAERVLSGDTAAFERLVDRYEHRVYQYALRYLGQEKDACQATEDIFLKIYRRLHSRMETQLTIWVFRITAEVCADQQHHRRGSAHRRSSEDKDLSADIQTLLLQLQRQQREVLLLRDLCGLNDEQTAQVLEMDVSGVRQRLSRARKNLRDQLIRCGALETTAPPQTRATQRECQRYRELCSRYVDECIAADEKEELLGHIQVCEQCAAYLNDLTLIGRTLSHMESEKPDKELRERILEACKKQAEQVPLHRDLTRLPIFILAGVVGIFLILAASGVLGGFFINRQSEENSAYATGLNAEDEYILREQMSFPEVVTANSYAFVIAAAGGSDLPELSDSAVLLSGDTGDGIEYYLVNSDINLVQKLADGLESIGYQLGAVNNRQLVVSATASQGLFIIVRNTNDTKEQANSGSAGMD